jgi:hypothetical protein
MLQVKNSADKRLLRSRAVRNLEANGQQERAAFFIFYLRDQGTFSLF